MNNQNNLQNVPIMTKESFCAHVGITAHSLNSHLRKNYLCVIKLSSSSGKSKKSYINIEALRQICITDAAGYIEKFGGDKNV